MFATACWNTVIICQNIFHQTFEISMSKFCTTQYMYKIWYHYFINPYFCNFHSQTQCIQKNRSVTKHLRLYSSHFWLFWTLCMMTVQCLNELLNSYTRYTYALLWILFFLYLLNTKQVVISSSASSDSYWDMYFAMIAIQNFLPCFYTFSASLI